MINHIKLHLKKIATIVICVGVLVSCGREIGQLEAVSSFHYPVPSLVAADISNDGKIIALLNPNEFSVWSAETNELINRWELTELKEPQYFISLSKNNKFAATASRNQVSVFNIQSQEVVGTWDMAGFSKLAKITSLKFNESGEQFFVGLNEGTVVKVDLRLNKKSIFQIHSSNVNFIELNYKEDYALTASVDGSIEYFNTVTGEIASSFKADTRITSLILDNRSAQFFYSDALNTHQVIDLNSSKVVSTLNYIERFKYFRKGILLDNGATLFNSTPKDQIAVWNLKSGEQVQQGRISAMSLGSTVLDIALKNSNEIATISSDGIIEIWNTKPRN